MEEKAISNGNEPANGYAIPEGYWSHNPGLTKREQFAAMAMQGIFASVSGNEFPLIDAFVKKAVEAADALLLELEKTAQ